MEQFFVLLLRQHQVSQALESSGGMTQMRKSAPEVSMRTKNANTSQCFARSSPTYSSTRITSRNRCDKPTRHVEHTQ
jgi:hypothetical protein